MIGSWVKVCTGVGTAYVVLVMAVVYLEMYY